MIHERLDCCNSVLYSTSAATERPLCPPTTQRPSLPTYTGCRSNIECNTRLQSLFRPTFELLTTQEPSYLTDVRFHVPSRHVRCCNGNLLQKDDRHQLRLHWSLVLSSRIYSLEQSTTVWPFQSNLIQATAKTELYNLAMLRQRLIDRHWSSDWSVVIYAEGMSYGQTWTFWTVDIVQCFTVVL